LKIAREANLILFNREARLGGPNGLDSKPKIQWAALAAAHEIPSEKSESLILAQIYHKVRTFFENSV
jgi:hypothetical protein